MRIRSTKSNTYGQRKTSILLSLINSLLIVAAVAVIFSEAIHRFYRPAEFNGYTVSIVAAVGVGVNFLTAFLLFRDRKKDINVKGAYLHMLADGLVSVGVIVSGIIIRLTHLSWIDPVVSIVIGLVVLYSTWDLLKESLRMTVDALPRNIDLEDVKKKIGSVKGVLGVHHIHIWAISTSENAMTGHVLIAADTTPQQVESIKHNIRHQLEHLQIVHSTLEMEYTGALCEHKNC
jgi:cobalt-zinc-cadmium efflux system protein